MERRHNFGIRFVWVDLVRTFPRFLHAHPERSKSIPRNPQKLQLVKEVAELLELLSCLKKKYELRLILREKQRLLLKLLFKNTMHANLSACVYNLQN